MIYINRRKKDYINYFIQKAKMKRLNTYLSIAILALLGQESDT